MILTVSFKHFHFFARIAPFFSSSVPVLAGVLSSGVSFLRNHLMCRERMDFHGIFGIDNRMRQLEERSHQQSMALDNMRNLLLRHNKEIADIKAEVTKLQSTNAVLKDKMAWLEHTVFGMMRQMPPPMKAAPCSPPESLAP